MWRCDPPSQLTRNCQKQFSTLFLTLLRPTSSKDSAIPHWQQGKVLQPHIYFWKKDFQVLGFRQQRDLISSPLAWQHLGKLLLCYTKVPSQLSQPESNSNLFYPIGCPSPVARRFNLLCHPRFTALFSWSKSPSELDEISSQLILDQQLFSDPEQQINSADARQHPSILPVNPPRQLPIN